MLNRKSLLTACGAILGLTVAVASANAWVNPSRTTYLTFSGPVSLPGVTLGTGTYVFELAEPGSRLDIVRVMDKNRSQVYFMAFTELVAKPAGLPANHHISFSEAPRGIAPPIAVWYPSNDATGRRFIYSTKR